jgi:hypothetical protein
MAPNSLFGAMAVGGMALALRLRQIWPGLVLNETHPKVLLHALRGRGYAPKDLATVSDAVEWFIAEGRYTGSCIGGEHELDAALSAWATQRGIAEKWIDIVGDRDELLFPAREVCYFWPESLEYAAPSRPRILPQEKQ